MIEHAYNSGFRLTVSRLIRVNVFLYLSFLSLRDDMCLFVLRFRVQCMHPFCFMSLPRFRGGSMLAGAVLGPVGALAGAIGGAIAGSRAGAAASEG